MNKVLTCLSAVMVAWVLVLPVAIPAAAAPGDLAPSVTPHNPPVVIQPTGGSFVFTVEVASNSMDDETFDVWTSATFPDGQTQGLEQGPYAFLLPAGWRTDRAITQSVPADAPDGTYTFSAYIGFYPDVVWSSASLDFEKLAAGGQAGWYGQNAGTTDYLTSVHFSDNANGWAVGIRNTILRTSDGGDNWFAQVSPPSVNYYDVFTTDNANGWAVGSSGKISHTADGGSTWVAQTSGTRYSLYGVFFIDNNTGWIAGGRERSFSAPVAIVLHTTDGGQSWTRQYSKSNQEPLQDVHFIDAFTGWAVGGQGAIMHTADGGATWTSQSSGTGYGLNRVFFTDINNGWAVGAKGNLLHTVNGGGIWFAQDPGTTLGLADVHFVNALRGWVASGDATTGLVLATNDGGNTWYPQNNPATGFLRGIVFTDENNGWAVGLNGTIVHTTGGGE